VTDERTALNGMTTSAPSDDLQVRMNEAVVADRRAMRRLHGASVLTRVLVIAAFLALWEWASATERLSNARIFYGRPSGVFRYIVDHPGDLWSNARATMTATLWGFVLGSVLGVLAGAALARWPFADRVMDPINTVLASIPRIALAPLFLLWFGITSQAKVAVAFSAVFFVVLFNARAGIKATDEDLGTVGVLLGASRRQVFTKIILPGAVPMLFAGLRLALIYSLLGVVAVEMIGAREGIGVVILTGSQLLQPNSVFAAIAVLAAMIFALSVLLGAVERRLLSWTADSRSALATGN
jgi:NitT/TauT family transport system permease protein